MHACLDDLVIAGYVTIDDFLARSHHPRRGRPPQISDAEIITLAVAAMLLDTASERAWLRLVSDRLGHLFPYVPDQPGYNKRLRALASTICAVLDYLGRCCPSFCDRVRLTDSTPVPCGASRETVRRSELAGYATYGWSASHSRWFWGFRLYLLSTPDGVPVDWCLAPANEPEREIAAVMLERQPLQPGQVLVTDKGFAGTEFEGFITGMGAVLVRPDRKDEQPRFGKLGGMRQWIESINDTLKGQLGLERHGGRTLDGLFTRIATRLLAMVAALWFNWQLGSPGRHLIANDH